MTLVEYKACGTELGTRWLPRLALLFGIAAVGIAHAATNAGSATTSTAPTSKQAEQQAQALAALQMTGVDWHKGGFNSVMFLNATVQNTGKRDVKDIDVVCINSSDGETKLDSNFATIYGPFPAGKSKPIHEFDMGVFHDQTKTTKCSIVHATLVTKRWGRAAK